MKSKATQSSAADVAVIQSILERVRAGALTPEAAANEMCAALCLAHSAIPRCVATSKAVLAEVLARKVADPVELLEGLFDHKDQGLANAALGRIYLALPQADRNRITSLSTFPA